MNWNKLKAFKRSSKQDSSSEFSESDLMNLCEDSSDDLAEMLEEFEIFAKDLQAELNTDELKPDDYILVQFHEKKSVKHYVAKIIEMQDKHEVFVVEYLKKCLDSNKFKIEKDAELFEVNVEDITLKLPAPTIVGGTERREKQLIFPASFAGYHVG